MRGAVDTFRVVAFWFGVAAGGVARAAVVVGDDARRVAARAVSSPSTATACPKAIMPRHTQKISLNPFIPLIQD